MMKDIREEKMLVSLLEILYSYNVMTSAQKTEIEDIIVNQLE